MLYNSKSNNVVHKKTGWMKNLPDFLWAYFFILRPIFRRG